MRILSFDIGIKNLAYCLLDYNDNKLVIKEWNIINLIECNINKCSIKECINKTEKYINIEKKKYYICNEHIINKKYLEEYNNINWIIVNNLKCIKCDIEKETLKNINNDIILCNKHYKYFLNKISNEKLNDIKKTNANKISSDEKKRLLIYKLDLLKEIFLTYPNIILIENQPSLKNPIMKSIADTLYSWFIIRGIFDKELNNSNIEEIKYISPLSKLKRINKDKKLSYIETKKLAIKTCYEILIKYNLKEWEIFFNNNDKKDDLADCFLQGWQYLNIQ